ncbi:hypothetical protein C1645_782737 [Glomus cerebriforme]|uniref:Uncharacterized protein n=1 Tax=Glomus cerebriforme TaxID=658196 RepID=A0A397SHK4_9GLOM|nr:hypothetical protein C1645_782737 [Glomus cerebriforme]
MNNIFLGISTIFILYIGEIITINGTVLLKKKPKRSANITLLVSNHVQPIKQFKKRYFIKKL